MKPSFTCILFLALTMLGCTSRVPAADQRPLVINPTTGKQEQLQPGNYVTLPNSAGTLIRFVPGVGSPEGVVTAGVGSLYYRTDGGAGTTLYTKESGAGNTGWAPLGGSTGITGTLTSGQVVYANGVTTVTGDSAFTYDATVGLNIPKKLTVLQSDPGDAIVYISTAGGAGNASFLYIGGAPQVSNYNGIHWEDDATGGDRWFLGRVGLESGANAGSNLRLAAYTDVGGLIGTVLDITRAANGPATWTRPNLFPAATTSIPSIRLPHGTAPSSPTNGDMWTTTNGLFVQINGSTSSILSGTLTSGQVPYANGTASLTSSAKMIYSNSTGFNVNLASTGTDNLTLGTAAGDLLGTGSRNVALGINAGTTLDNANDSVAIGYNALSALASPSGNVAIGSGAADGVTGSSRITAIGFNALGSALALSAVDDNVAIGHVALQNCRAANNTAVGSQSSLNISTGTNNTALGAFTLTSAAVDDNTAIGASALVSNFGSRNTSVGSNSAKGVAGFNDTTAVGYNALLNNTATNNTAIGSGAGSSNTSAAGLTAVGKNALSTSIGANNTAVGLNAGNGVSTGTSNTIMGSGAGSGVGNGSGNVIIGYNSNVGAGLNSNTVLGAEASATGASTSECIFLGRGASTGVTATGQMIIGGDTYEILDVWIGEGQSNNSPQAVSLGNTRASGTNTAGVNFTIRASAGTGTGAGGSLVFQTAPAGASGATTNTQTTALTIDSTQRLTAASTENATSVSTGAVVVAGGGAFTKNLIGGQGFGVGAASTVTAASTTTLTNASAVHQKFTGTTTQTVTLPAANAFGSGVAVCFLIANASTGNVTVQRAGSDTFLDGTTSVVLTGGSFGSLWFISDGSSVWTVK